MTGIIAMMTMRARTEIREIRRAGENLRIGNGRRIEMVKRSSVGSGRRRCQPQVGTVPQQTSKWLIKSQKVPKTQ